MIPGKAADRTVIRAKPTRTIVGSRLKYSAIPPHTPASFLSYVDLVSCLVILIDWVNCELAGVSDDANAFFPLLG